MFTVEPVSGASWALVERKLNLFFYPASGLFPLLAVVVEPLLYTALHAVGRWLIVLLPSIQTTLRYESAVEVMRVEVADSIAQVFGSLVMGVTQMLRDGQGAAQFNVCQGCVDGDIGTITFRRGGQIDRGVAEDDPSFRHADKLDGLLCCHGHTQGIAISHTHVFTGGDDDDEGDDDCM